MNVFVIGAVLLVAVAALLLLWRRSSGLRDADLGDPNLEWYQQRSAELSDDAPELLDDMGLRMLEEGVGVDRDADAGSASTPAAGGAAFPLRPIGAVLLLALVLLAVPLYLQLGALPDVLIYRQLEQLEPGNREALRGLTARVEQRSTERPENLYYRNLLGQLQMSGADYPAAADTFGALALAAPEDPGAQAQAAQALYVRDGRNLSDEAQFFAERALALDPHQGTALGLLGMAAFERGQYAPAISYWQRLQAVEAPGSQSYQMLDEVIRVAQTRLEQEGGDTPLAAAGGATQSPESGTEPRAASSTEPGGDTVVESGVTVELEIADGSVVPGQGTVFVFARPSGASGGMPIAVRRLRAGDLPITLRLSDADSMAGQLLSQAGEVVISAQLSRNGQPGLANAAFSGTSAPIAAGDGAARVRVLLAPTS